MPPTRWRIALLAVAGVVSACSPSSEQAGPPPTAPVTTADTAVPSSTPLTGPPTTTTTVVRSLPLGDGRRSTAPEVGSVWSCQTTFGPAGGAFRDGPWIKSDGTWDPTEKIAVQGAVAWAGEHSTENGATTRSISTNGVPSRGTTGQFPIAADDPAYQYDRNPNTITPRSTTLALPIQPALATAPSCVPMGAIGVFDDGVALFNALDAQGRDAAAHEVLDRCDGHPERSGQYHRHTVPSCFLSRLGSPHLVGYAMDGFGIYIERHPDGRLLTNADLDGCHGRTSPVTWDTAGTVSMYHYVATLEYPYTVGCYRGTPVRR